MHTCRRLVQCAALPVAVPWRDTACPPGRYSLAYYDTVALARRSPCVSMGIAYALGSVTSVTSVTSVRLAS